jgi:hypothetical protein
MLQGKMKHILYVQYTFFANLDLNLSIYAMHTFPNSFECVQTVEILHRIITLQVLLICRNLDEVSI